MFKYKYIITYRVRPNKNTEGADFARKMTLTRPLDDDEKKKIARVISIEHRVNQDAVHILKLELTCRELQLKQWLTKNLIALLKKAFAIVGTTR